MNLDIQFELFIYSLFIGVYLGVTYDLLYYFILMHLKKITKYFLDIIFFVIQSFIVFKVIYRINYGVIPVYCYFIFLIGFLFYYRFSQKLYEDQIYPLKKIFIKIWLKLVKILHYLIIQPFLDIWKVLIYIYVIIEKRIRGFINYVKQKIHKKKNKKNKI